jgi:hypothetical protein
MLGKLIIEYGINYYYLIFAQQRFTVISCAMHWLDTGIQQIVYLYSESLQSNEKKDNLSI